MELRIALVCYGGVSLAIYMHGVTKELWKLLRASQSHAALKPQKLVGTEAVYADILNYLTQKHGVNLRVLTDIVAGASAGGINCVFLAQAIHSGQSLEPLTDLWLERADVDVLLDPDARPWSRYTKLWATPLVSVVLKQPGNAVSDSVAPETHDEVREKLSRLIRSRWFDAPFGGLGFSRLLHEALIAMQSTECGMPLLPPGHPIDLFVTATDFHGHLETMHLNSPPIARESEHRMPLGFRSVVPHKPNQPLASPLELVFAARATASFPGAFPALQISEIDTLAKETRQKWPNRDAFLKRVMPEHYSRGDIDKVSLIDGSVLVNAPFEDAMSVLRDRPAMREVDRRFVYIDPHPDRVGGITRQEKRAPRFFSIIFGSLSSIPRAQPIRDNLEALERKSSEMATLRSVVQAIRPQVEEAVETLFGRTLFFDKPTARRLAIWRDKAQNAACHQAGFAYQGYAQVKLAGIVSNHAKLIHTAAPDLGFGSPEPIARHLSMYIAANGMDRLTNHKGGTTTQAIEFFRNHDLAFRIRRLLLMARRMTQDWEYSSGLSEADRQTMREAIYGSLTLYRNLETTGSLGDGFPHLAKRVFTDPASLLDYMANTRSLAQTDAKVDAILAKTLAKLPEQFRQSMLLTYLGFPFYDTVTLPLLREEGLSEFDPVKVDRISPEDANSIRAGGAYDTLRGVELYNFGAFFSRAYRENDYLWGRLHGAERMIDLIASALPQDKTIEPEHLAAFKRDAFLAILNEEKDRLTADPSLVSSIQDEIANA